MWKDHANIYSKIEKKKEKGSRFVMLEFFSNSQIIWAKCKQNELINKLHVFIIFIMNVM